MKGLQILADVIKGAQADQPKEAMKSIAQEKLEESEDLPEILESIEKLTPHEIEELAGSTSGGQQQNGQTLAEQLNNTTLVIVPQVGHENWTAGDV
jgi:uncharacterized protein with von Willebrand factor type A (vWA) domain